MKLLSLIAPRTMILPQAPCTDPRTRSRGQRTVIEKIDRLSSVPVAPIQLRSREANAEVSCEAAKRTQKSDTRQHWTRMAQTLVSVGTYLRKEGPLAPKPKPLVEISSCSAEDLAKLMPGLPSDPCPLTSDSKHFTRETLAYYETMHAAGGQPHQGPIAAELNAFYATGRTDHLTRAKALIDHLQSLTAG